MNDNSLAQILSVVRYAAHELGKEGESGPGAIELLSMSLGDGCSSLSRAVEEGFDRLAESVERLAVAIEKIGGAQ